MFRHYFYDTIIKVLKLRINVGAHCTNYRSPINEKNISLLTWRLALYEYNVPNIVPTCTAKDVRAVRYNTRMRKHCLVFQVPCCQCVSAPAHRCGNTSMNSSMTSICVFEVNTRNRWRHLQSRYRRTRRKPAVPDWARDEATAAAFPCNLFLVAVFVPAHPQSMYRV